MKTFKRKAMQEKERAQKQADLNRYLSEKREEERKRRELLIELRREK